MPPPARPSSSRAWLRALESVALLQRDPTLTLPGMLDALAARHGSNPALVGAGGDLSYLDLARRANQVARWAAARYPHATIGLLLPNSTDYVAIWLGLTRAGCVVALLNHNLSGDALRHVVRAASCRVVIADDVFAADLGDVPVLSVAALDGPVGEGALPTPAPSDTALLVYTSGTTGLPKAARVSHGRVLEWALWFAGMIDVQPADRIYDCLPLYHSTGGIVAVGASLVRGASVHVAPGFSASGFWDGVADSESTIFFYIGELCRYLLRGPPATRAHRLRLACGNGLQEAVWEPFRKRFDIPQILEFYAATEGSVSLYNCEGRPGAIGRVPPFLQARFPLALIRLHADSREPVRDANGLCVPCAMGEAGEALGRVDDQAASPARRFDGYTDVLASSRKLLRDVFAPDDCWFRSGDLMRRDAAGFVYFVDRLGDTFRWKGENVSTVEVASVMRGAPGVRDAVVFGVRVPGQEGRAGMAAIVPDGEFDAQALWSHVGAALPGYAQPLFVRVCRSLDLTGTFKLSAARLARDSYTGISDPVHVAYRQDARYVLCDAEVLAAIESGAWRV